jgi:heat shock protein HtpX
MLRIGLFLLTNLAVMVVFGIVMNVIAPMLGFNLGGTGTTSLLVMCFIYGCLLYTSDAADDLLLV